MTEDEAKTKWCPFARVLVGSISTVMGPHTLAIGNRTDSGEGASKAKCLGSACMAWRWKEAATKTEPLMSHEEAIELGGPSAEAPTHDVPVTNRQGFCGLAGKP